MICWVAAISIDCSFCPPTNSFNPNPVVEEARELIEYDYTECEEQSEEETETDDEDMSYREGLE